MTEHNLLKYNFYSTVIADILKAIEGGSYGGAFILSFCCIDYFSVPIAHQQGKNKTSKDDFKLFVKNYLTQVNSKYNNLHDELYAIRCSLIHSYGESDATNKIQLTPNLIFDETISNLHLTLEKNKTILYINLSDFVSELITAIEIFFHQNSESTTLSEWSKKLYFHQNTQAIYNRNMIKNGAQVSFKSIHLYLETLDNNKTFETIHSNIKEIIGMSIINKIPIK
jgi:hypothetical protein